MHQPKTGSSNEYDQITPRLFRLRDLHPSKTIEPSTSAKSVTGCHNQAVSGYHNPAEMADSGKSPAFEVPPASTSVCEQAAATSVMVDEIAEEATQQLRTRERIERHLDASPEGRSWMESALAHRKVLLLLAIAIGAALWTGRGDQQQSDSDAEFAQTNGTLEFDPTQFDAGTIVNEGQDFFPSETAGDSRSQGLIANPNSSATTSPANQLSVDQNSHEVRGGEGAAQANDTSKIAGLASNSLVPNKNSGAAVAAPTGFAGQTASPSSQTLLSESRNTAPEANNSVAAATMPSQPEREVSQIYSNGLTVEAVSSRTPRDPGFDAPSLEDLQRVSEDTAPNQLGTEVSLKDSSTPNGVSDWLKYLPPQP